jgi:uncharacterized membrane protein YphA (DoxX/SURF4 family)
MATEIEVRERAAVDVALLIARLIVGVVFMAHGAQKLFRAFAGPGHSAVVQMMGPLVSRHRRVLWRFGARRRFLDSLLGGTQSR